MSSLHISQNVKLGQAISQKMIQSVKILQMNAQELSGCDLCFAFNKVAPAANKSRLLLSTFHIPS